MNIKEILLYIENHGISILFMISCGIAFWRYLVPYMEKNTALLQEMKDFLEHFNKNEVTGKGLQLLLNLKVEEIKWAIEKKYKQYIDKNNIVQNYNNILLELANYKAQKMLAFDDDLRDIIDKSTYSNIKLLFATSIDETVINLTSILETLKESSLKDTDYQTAKRAVSTHMNNFENELKGKINSLFN